MTAGPEFVIYLLKKFCVILTVVDKIVLKKLLLRQIQANTVFSAQNHNSTVQSPFGNTYSICDISADLDRQKGNFLVAITTALLTARRRLFCVTGMRERSVPEKLIWESEQHPRGK